MTIEECGTGGTCKGKFTRRNPIARVSWDSERRIATLTSLRTHEPLAEIDCGYMTVHDPYDGRYVGNAEDWHGAVRLALGSNSYGHSWYQVAGKSRLYVPAEARL